MPSRMDLTDTYAYTALLDAVKNELLGKQLAEYASDVESLKNTLQEKSQDKGKFRKLISALSFANDTTASFELMAKAWPYISILLQFAAQIFAK